MKSKFLNFILRYLQKRGYFLEKFPDWAAFYKTFREQPDAVKEFEIKRMAVLLKRAKFQKGYDSFLKFFVPDWDLEIKKSKFMGIGWGEGSLDTYRKVITAEDAWFEKVYFNSSPDLEIFRWYEANIHSLTASRIKIPKVKRIYGGKIITLVYFEFLNLKPQESSIVEKQLTGLARTLYELSLEKESVLSQIDFLELIKNYKTRSRYLKNYQLTKSSLEKNGIDVGFFEQNADASKSILTHGDIHEYNVFKGPVLIDWDGFSYFPLGYEPASIYFLYMLLGEYQGKDPKGWLEKNFKEFISDIHWTEVERNFTYFLYLFAAELFAEGKYPEIEQRLIIQFKNLQS